MSMSTHEFRLIAAGWFLVLLFLTIFWYATLSRLATILKERPGVTRSGSGSDFTSLFLFIFRGEFNQTGDARLIGVCKRLRSLLYGYLGGIFAYLVFLVLFRPHS